MSPLGDGLLLVDKPAGPTSHDVVARIRAAAGRPRTGHTGTLDPPATGLLVILLGRATRLARFLPDAPKVYEGTICLGVTTATDDLAGAVLGCHDGPLPGPAEVAAAAAGFLGRRRQVPPSVSARRIEGTRLYRLARRGAPVEPREAAIEVYRFDVSPTAEAETFAFAVEASTGTYVRALARDLGRSLGCGAAVATLRRTAIGPFDVRDALALPAAGPPDVEEVARRLVPLDALPLKVPSVALDDPADAGRFASGVGLPRPASSGAGEGPVAVRDPSGRLLGIGDLTAAGLGPRVVLAGSAGR